MQTWVKILFIVVGELLLWAIINNKRIIVTNYAVKGVDNLKIVHLSDIHNDLFGKNNINLVNKIKDINPDVILITGDLIDKRRTNVDIAINLIKQIKEVSPIYMVYGNHEATKSDILLEYESKLLSEGVNVLRNEVEMFKQISIIGLDDVNFCESQQKKEYLKEQLDKLVNGEKYKILLTHKPQYIDVYKNYDVDLILCGHAHGGQVRLPFIGGLFAPGQGVFPKYTSGMFTFGKVKMIVSRGLGNSLFPLRFNNNPQIIVINMEKGN